jgi:non-heme chloroperoxidase
MFESHQITPQESGIAPSNALEHEVQVTRRQMILGGAAAVALSNLPPVARASRTPSKSLGSRIVRGGAADTMITKDGTRIFFKDWGSGRPVVFSHGWPLNGDAWDAQMLFLAQHGYRVIAHDRRGHGRSGQSRGGNDLNTYADDLAQLITSLELKDVMLVGHSTGGGEVVRYIGRQGDGRLSKLVLIGSRSPPSMMSASAWLQIVLSSSRISASHSLVTTNQAQTYPKA